MMRCGWAGDDPLMIAYHDQEWGLPVHDDQALFEFLVLEGAQAGLSWSTVLRKRDAYRRAFEGFDPEVVARYGDAAKARLLGDAGIIRNRLKIASAIDNAKALLAVRERYRSFDCYIWQFVDGEPVQNAWTTLEDIPSRSPASEQMSKALKKQGFRFVGPTICYAFMQAVGMVNDHLVGCFRYAQLAQGHRIGDDDREA
jgi:DNA-3-methyladenine glycosylase I